MILTLLMVDSMFWIIITLLILILIVLLVILLQQKPNTSYPDHTRVVENQMIIDDWEKKHRPPPDRFW